MDFVQWTQASPVQDPNNWSNITYKYDPSGRRIEKDVDGYKTRYVYDGGNVIAEYDGNNNLTRKYIHGPCIDEPICMIDVADSNALYYYHYDASGSVVALSDSYGDSCQSYEYSAFGQVAASDPNFIANPYMFTGRRFDFETGLYYYRARYYNPYIGRFLQTDPIGYGGGINWYAYCGNNPVGRADPSGLYYGFGDSDNGRLTWAWFDNLSGLMTVIAHYENFDEWCDASDAERFTYGARSTIGLALSEHCTGRDPDWLYERVQALAYLGNTWVHLLDGTHSLTFNGITTTISIEVTEGENRFSRGTIYWNPSDLSIYEGDTNWYNWGSNLVSLDHELSHALDYFVQPQVFSSCIIPGDLEQTEINTRRTGELSAVRAENSIRYTLFRIMPNGENIWPRAGYLPGHKDVGRTATNSLTWSAADAWNKYWDSYLVEY